MKILLITDDPTDAEVDRLHEMLGDVEWEGDRDYVVIHLESGDFVAGPGDWIVVTDEGEVMVLERKEAAQ